MAGQPNTIGRGPLGVPTNTPVNDPGTSALIRNRPSVPLGTTATPNQPERRPTARLGGNREQGTDRFPRLQIGSRGKDVQRLQRLLNSRLESEPKLKVDGVFGPKTRAAVIEFQKGAELRPDGVVGRATWFSLVLADPDDTKEKSKPRAASALSSAGSAAVKPGQTAAKPGQAPSREDTRETPKPGPASAASASEGVAAAKPVSVAAQLATKRTVDQWPLSERFEYVLKHTGPHLLPEARAQFAALLTPTNLGIMVGSLVVWAAGHFFGVSEIVDAFLLGFGLVFLGKAAIDAARLLKNAIELTCSASTEAELEDAAKDLAEAIAIIGVMAFFALLAKVARAVGNKMKAGKGMEKGGAPPESKETGDTSQKNTTDSSKTTENKPPEEKAPPEKTPQEKLAERREALRQAKLKQAIAEAEAKGKLDKLDPADRDWLNDDPTGRRKELAYDPDTGSFKPDEAKAALQAEQDGSLKGPVKRAFNDEGKSGGADYVDGDGKPWDVKDASAGADSISEVAAPKGGKPGENVLVDCSDMNAADQKALESDIASRPAPPGTGQITFTPKRP